MYPWPTCPKCLEPMPWLATSKIVDVHICNDCGILSSINKTTKEEDLFYAASHKGVKFFRDIYGAPVLRIKSYAETTEAP